MLQLLKLVIGIVFVGTLFYVPHPVNGNLRGTSEGTCIVNNPIVTTPYTALGNLSQVIIIHHNVIKSDEYTSYNSYTLLHFE
jgi:hypothetical protein